MTENFEPKKETVEKFPVDADFFSRLKKFSPSTQDKEKIELFKKCVESTELKALKYTSEIMNELLLVDKPKGNEEDPGKHFRDLVHHDMTNLLGVAGLGLQVVGENPEWVSEMSSNSKKLLGYIREIEKASLKYGLEEALTRATSADLSGKETEFEQLKKEIFEKIEKLPEPIRANLFKVKL